MATKKKKKGDGARPIYAIARALDMSSKELRETISSWDDIDWDVSSHMKKLSAEQQQVIEKRLDVKINGDDDPKSKKSTSGGKDNQSKSKKSTSGGKDNQSKSKKSTSGGKDNQSKSKKSTSGGKDNQSKSKSTSDKKDKGSDDKSGDKKDKKNDEPQKDYVGIGKKWLVEALEKMGFSHPRVSGSIKDRTIEFDISGAETETLIQSKDAAAKTDVIDSIQQIMERVLFGNSRNSQKVIIDVQGFRAGRIKELSKAAEHAQNYVQETGKKLRFAAMNSFDRRAFHVGFQQGEEVRAKSHGYGVRRRLEVWHSPSDDSSNDEQNDDS